MYTPNLGRWLTDDPIAYRGEDTDLYRSEGNNPVTFVDPTGLILESSWERIASFPGPAIAKDPQKTYANCRPTVDFYQVVGTRGAFTGRYSQPPSAAADHSEGPVADPLYQYGKAYSELELKNSNDGDGVCNTPVYDEKPDNPADKLYMPNAGSIKMSFNLFKPGTYKVKVGYEYSLDKDEGTIAPAAHLYVPGAAGQIDDNKDNFTLTGIKAGTKSGSGTLDLTVVVPFSGSVDVAGFSMIITGQTGRGKARITLGAIDIT